VICHSGSHILRLSNDFLIATIKAKAKEKLIQVKSRIPTDSHPLPAAGQSSLAPPLIISFAITILILKALLQQLG
jgi:hypothetical protein